MIDLIAEKVLDPRTMGIALTAIAAAATAFAVVQPFLETDNLAKRMKLVSDEREVIRRRERERLTTKATLRVEPKAYMKQIVERFDLRRWLGTDTAKRKLLMAGYRGQQSETTFLFFRLVMPVAATLGSLFYLFVLEALDEPYLMRVGHRHRLRLRRHQGSGTVPRQQVEQAQGRDQAGLARCPRPDADLRRIGHGDRACVPEGEQRDRRPARWCWPRNSP